MHNVTNVKNIVIFEYKQNLIRQTYGFQYPKQYLCVKVSSWQRSHFNYFCIMLYIFITKDLSIHNYLNNEMHSRITSSKGVK